MNKKHLNSPFPFRLLVFSFLVMAFLVFSQCRSLFSYETDTFKITKLNENAFVHTSFLRLASGLNFPCNGLVYINNGEAIVMDTPTTSRVSNELIEWIRNEKHAKVVAVIVNHFHVDCLGGLAAFHDAGIPSYAHAKTNALVDQSKYVLVQNTFPELLELTVGGQQIESRFFGEGHTVDNIVTWIPSEKILFGGCMIKSLGASQGNTADANLGEWSNTVMAIKNQYGEFNWVVPGHGAAGTVELLDYTIEKFVDN